MKSDIVILSQTDTTVGLLSQDAKKLDEIKQRAKGKKYITALPSLKALKSRARVPKEFKKIVRRGKKITFIFPSGNSYRVIKDKTHLLLIKRYGWLYTTSANLSGKELDLEFAKERADIIIYPLNPNGKSSTIYRLGRAKLKKIR